MQRICRYRLSSLRVQFLKVQRIQCLLHLLCVCVYACLECDVREETEIKNMLAAEAYLVKMCNLKPVLV